MRFVFCQAESAIFTHFHERCQPIRVCFCVLFFLRFVVCDIVTTRYPQSQDPSLTLFTLDTLNMDNTPSKDLVLQLILFFQFETKRLL